MNRLLVTIAAAAVLYGCARTAVNTPVADQPYYDSLPTEVAAAPTTIVREVHYQAPEVYVDTVYLEYEPPAETVYVEEPVYIEETVEYETYVFVPDPPPHYPHPRMSPPGHGRHRSRGGPDPRRGDEPRERGRQPSGPRDRAEEPRDGGRSGGGGRPGGGGGRPPQNPGQPADPHPTVVGPTDGPKRSEPPRPAEPTPTPTAPVPSRPQTRLVRSESPATPAVQSPESADAVFTIPVRDVKPVPVERSAAAEQGS